MAVYRNLLIDFGENNEKKSSTPLEPNDTTVNGHDKDLDAFTMTNRREIVFYLRQLINDGEALHVMFDDGHETLLTLLLDLDEEQDRLILDWGGSESVNRRLLESTRATFVANPVGVRNLFHTGRIWEVTYQQRPAFATDIPRKYIRLQRREFFRLMLPLTERRPCHFAACEGGTEKQWKMTIVDIGIGGIGLESQVAALPFDTTQIIRRAHLDLGKFGSLTFDMEVRYTQIVTRAHKPFVRIGCRFLGLSQAQESALQRFITQVQREERARLG